MTDLQALVQLTLDTKFKGELRAFWQVKTGDLSEYIVYTLGQDKTTSYADNVALVKNADVTLRYYYDLKKLSTSQGRALIKSKLKDILECMKSAGFTTDTEFFDGGDIDNIGYMTSICEFNYPRVV